MSTSCLAHSLPTKPNLKYHIFFSSSYAQDPPFALLFTYIWVSAAGFCVLLASPRLYRSLRNGRFIASMRGIGWNYNALSDYQRMTASEKEKESTMPVRASGRSRLRGLLTAMAIWSLYSPPHSRLDIGQSTCYVLPVARQSASGSARPDLPHHSRYSSRISHDTPCVHHKRRTACIQLQSRWYGPCRHMRQFC